MIGDSNLWGGGVTGIYILIVLIFYVVAESIDEASPPRKDSKISKQARENVEEASKLISK